MILLVCCIFEILYCVVLIYDFVGLLHFRDFVLRRFHRLLVVSCLNLLLLMDDVVVSR